MNGLQRTGVPAQRKGAIVPEDSQATRSGDGFYVGIGGWGGIGIRGGGLRTLRFHGLVGARGAQLALALFFGLALLGQLALPFLK